MFLDLWLRPLMYPPTPSGPQTRVQLILTEKSFPKNDLCADFVYPPPPHHTNFSGKCGDGMGFTILEMEKCSRALFE